LLHFQTAFSDSITSGMNSARATYAFQSPDGSGASVMVPPAHEGGPQRLELGERPESGI